MIFSFLLHYITQERPALKAGAEGVSKGCIAKSLRQKDGGRQKMLRTANEFITWFDGLVWGLPLIILILATGIYLTARLKLLQCRHLGKALKYMVRNEDGGSGEVTSFGALCTALSATIGTGNIVGVATAIAAGGPGALFWREWLLFSVWLQNTQKGCLPSAFVQ